MPQLREAATIFRYATTSRVSQTKTYDQESGQVYTEMVAKGSPMTTDWAWKTIGSSRLVGRFRSRGPGCASLFNMAIRSTLVHNLSITSEGLQGVPWEVANHLWRAITFSQLDSIRIWEVFATAYPTEFNRVSSCKHYIILQPHMKLSSYTDPLISPSFHWITFLTLSDIICSRSDLVQLYCLTNLGVLTIDHGVMCPDVGLDDSIVRSWSRAATESNSFSMLRVLNCRSQQNISSRLFEYLNSFPSLSVFNVEDCSIGYKDQLSSSKVGWQYVVGKKLKEFLSAHGSDEGDYSWNSVGRSFFKGGGTYSAKQLTAEGVEAINSLPVLQFSLGAAPPDASLEIIVHKGMRSFQRMQHSIATSTSGIKRSIEVYDQSNAEPRKKPRMRPSKQKYMEELFNGFGS